MKAPDAARRLSEPGCGVTALVVVVVSPPAPVPGVAAATDDVVEDGSVAAVSGPVLDVVSAGAVDVDESALFRSEEPDEQAMPVTARTRNKMRMFTGATIGRRIRCP